MANQAIKYDPEDAMSNLLINEPPLQVLPSLAKAIGLNEALVLQQVHYWLRHAKVEHDGKMWIYKTYDEWQKQDFSFWSVRTVKRAVINLIDLNLLTVEKLSSNSFNRVNHYTINYAELSKIAAVNQSKPVIADSDNLAQSKVADCHKHSDNLAQSDSDNMTQSDSDNLAQCLRDIKENTNKNTKERAAANHVYSVLDSISNWQEPELNQINAMLIKGAPPVAPLTDDQYQHYANEFKNYHAEKEVEGTYIRTENRRKDMLASWIRRDFKNSSQYKQRFETQAPAKTHSNRSDAFSSNQPTLSREEQIKRNEEAMRLAGVAL